MLREIEQSEGFAARSAPRSAPLVMEPSLMNLAVLLVQARQCKPSMHPPISPGVCVLLTP